jgi:Fe2+ or Zn2+ uptake regulation protein
MNQLQIYFNTNSLRGDELQERKVKNGSQNAEVLSFFSLYHYHSFTPAQVYEHFQKQGRTWPLTSVRRAITTLMNEGFLVQTGEFRMGLYGSKNMCYKLK